MSAPRFNLWQAFLASAERDPDRPALLLQTDAVTYGALKTHVLRAAAFLRGQGVRRGDVVMLHLPKSLETYALLLACLRLGAAHCCIDVGNPAHRTAQMLDRVRPRLLCTGTDGLSNPHGGTIRLIAGASDMLSLENPLPEDPEFILQGGEPAYVMFTSGSTGEPKGVVIPHQGVLTLMAWADAMFGPPRERRHSGLNPIHFDNSIFDIYCGLVGGAGLVPVETATHDPAAWLNRLRGGGATVCFAVPTFFMLLDDLGLLTPEHLPAAKVFVFGGEGFPVNRLRTFHERFRHSARLVNVYGPTETSCICSSLEIDDAALGTADGFPSLGRMHANFDHAVLDDGRKPAAPGTAGELWIGGPCVALGYYGDPARTAERFIQDPRQDRFRAIVYRSGDLVREADDGALWFVGRADNQVKIAGHRIELEEIDHAVEAIGGVLRAASVVSKDGAVPEICTAFSSNHALSKPDILAGCRARLPAYMMPSRIARLEEMPLNANGKVDRLAVAAIFSRLAASETPPERARAGPTGVTADPHASLGHRDVPPMTQGGAEALGDIENRLEAIWCDVLGLPSLRMSENFFDLGGTSVQLTKVFALLSQTEPDLPMIALFEYPTIEALAAHLAGRHSGADAVNAPRHRATAQAQALNRLRAQHRDRK